MEQQRWYTLQTKPQKESFVEQRLKNRGLEVFLPWIRQRRRIGTRYVWASVPLFPGYLFCRLEFATEGRAIRYWPGVKDFVMFGEIVADVGDEVVGMLKERCPGGFARIEVRPYVRGEKVLIKEGALTGLEGVFERQMKSKDRVAVLLELLGRETRLVVASHQIGRP